jgi:hypothetical protein
MAKVFKGNIPVTNDLLLSIKSKIIVAMYGEEHHIV